MRWTAAAVALICATHAASAGSLDTARLSSALTELVSGFDGRVGVCVQDTGAATCINGTDRFPMQSVVKLAVAVAVLDAADRDVLRLADRVLIKPEDLSVFVQPIARLVTADGLEAAVGDLLSRMMIESDSAACDVLIAKLGGPPAVQAALTGKRIAGVRVDRDERHLQTEMLGLTWQPGYVDAAALKRAIDAVPAPARQAALDAYLADPRDTATPLGMTALLTALVSGRLLSPASTRRLLDAMRRTTTFPDRLKAGLPPGWSLGHKTGTSGTWQGITAATNDVGIMTAPDGGSVAVAVFIRASRRTDAERAALIADVARRIVQAYR